MKLDPALWTIPDDDGVPERRLTSTDGWWPTLQPCPFCGEKRLSLQLHEEYFFTCCDACLASGPPALTADEAIARWNVRRVLTEGVP